MTTARHLHLVPAPEPGPEPEPLWREVLGAELRRLRHERDLTLTDVAGRAGVSAQYLSEVERGRKDASSEMLAAIAGALDMVVLELTSVASGRALVSRPLAPSATSSAPSGHDAQLLAA